MKTVGSFSSEAGAADPIAEQTREQFETEVFPAELVQIRERRAKLGQPLGKSQRPDPRLGLVGLALSGGGIRSASLALGFVQRLAQQGVLERVDYLSTVSGGGLTGACLSAVLNSPDTSTKPDRFPLVFKAGEPESSAIRHLRDHSNYLAPGGLVDKVRLPAVIFRGIVNNFAVLLPLLMLAVQLTEVFYALLYQWVNITLQMMLFVTLALFLAGILVEPVLRDFLPNRFNWRVRDGYENFISRTLLALLVITILVIPTFLLVQRAIDFDPQQQFNQNIVPRAHWILFGAIVAAVMVAMKASRSIGSTPGKVFIVVVGLSSYVLVFGIYLALVMYQIDSPLLPSAVQTDLVPNRAIGDVLRSALVEKDLEISANATVQAGKNPNSWVVVDGSNDYTIWRATDGKFRVDSFLLIDGPGDYLFIAITVLGLIYSFTFANPNITSPNGFLRDRLSRAFVFTTDRSGAVHPMDDLKMSGLNRDGSVAPYHIFNATLNLEGSEKLSLAGRGSSFMVFTRNYVGGPVTGYCETKKLESYDSQFNLATAMTISGASLAPNMGAMTVKSLVFVMTLLNLRLDYWLPNPRVVHSGSLFGRARLHGHLGPLYLMKEAIGDLKANGPFVNVSDGGHLENLGVYELLRRRCACIIAVDAGEDAAMQFPDLIRLLRFARIDFGIQIDIDLQPLGLGPDGLSSKHCVTGTIHYADNATGRLIYVKPSLTGDEPELIRGYKAAYPAFPQESSANQFFTEEKFEAYRALGEHMAIEAAASFEQPRALGQRA